MSKPLIIGLAGTLASGKDTVGVLLAEKYGFLHISTSDMLRAAKKKKYGNTPESLLLRNDPFAIELRTTKGPGVLVDLALEEYKKRQADFPGGLVASGIRSIGEAEAIKQAGGTIIFVDADPKIRYKRTIVRKRDDNENDTTFEQFIASEKSEISDTRQDKTIANLAAMNERADIHLENNGNDIEVFKAEAEKQLAQLLKTN